MNINAYLTFDGRCQEAFTFYEKCLKGKIVAVHTHRGTPMESEMPADWLDKVMHITLAVGDQLLMGSDSPPQYYQAPSGFSVSLNISTSEEAEQVFSALSVNGIVKMPITETFWATRFGMLVDQYGIPWMINCEKHA